MDNILDSKQVVNNSTKYSKISFLFAITSLCCLGYMFSLIPSTIKVSEGFPSPSIYLIRMSQLSVFLGLVFTILSITRKENNTLYKWIGATLNILFVIFIIGSTIMQIMNQ